MPNPGAMTSMQAFDRESINTVIHIPDYKLRRNLSLQQREALIVEAFVAFEEMFYLHLRWSDVLNYPEISLSSMGARYHKLMLDLNVQSPHFTYCIGEGANGASPQWIPCTWSTPGLPMEINRPSSTVHLQVDRSPSYHNDVNISFEQTVTFTLTATMWELDDSPIISLHCRSYRAQAPGPNREAATTAARMIENIAALRHADDVPPDIHFQLDLDTGPTSDDQGDGDGGDTCSVAFTDTVSSLGPSLDAHAFVLQAQSPVFRRMLGGPMIEATQRVVKMAGVTKAELEDFLSSLYQLGVPTEVQEDDSRLCSLLALLDRYEVIPLRDECARLLEARLTEGNMAAIVKVAELHHAPRLRTAALDFIASRIERIVMVMDTGDPSVRAAVREHVDAVEAAYKANSAAADLKPISDTLTV